MHERVNPKSNINFYYCPKKGKDWKKGKLEEIQKWFRGKIGEHGCDNIHSVNIPLLDSFVITKVRETLSNSHKFKDTFKKEVLKEKQIGQKDTWEYERLVRVENKENSSGKTSRTISFFSCRYRNKHSIRRCKRCETFQTN